MGVKAYRCPFCGFETDSERELVAHLAEPVKRKISICRVSLTASDKREDGKEENR